jgi:hypothetical protein
LAALVGATWFGLFPVSWQLADLVLVNRPFNPKWDMSILLVWTDRVEIRRVNHLSEISPRQQETPYGFLVPLDRREWVEEQVRRYPSVNPDAGWIIQVKILGPERQQIRLESFGDGIRGLVYEATPTEIIPQYFRLTGPVFPLIVILLQFTLWGILWLGVYLVSRYRRWRLGFAPAQQVV